MPPAATRRACSSARLASSPGRWDERRAVYQEMPYFTAPEMTRAAIAWLERHRDTSLLPVPELHGRPHPERGARVPGPALRGRGPAAGAEREMLDRFLAGAELTPAERRSIVNEYDREVIHLDHWVGVLLDYLERSGLGARTLVVLTSDHGEFLGEHQLHRTQQGSLHRGGRRSADRLGARRGARTRLAPGPEPGPVPDDPALPGAADPRGDPGAAALEADHPTVSEQYYATPTCSGLTASASTASSGRSASASIATSRAPAARSGSSTSSPIRARRTT